MTNPTNKTFGELIGAKRKCERQIVEALSEFIKETGLRIDDLQLTPLDVTTFGDNVPKNFITVKLTVRIP